MQTQTLVTIGAYSCKMADAMTDSQRSTNIKVCPRCGREDDRGNIVCPEDGTALKKQDKLIGTTIAEKYEILSRLGRGGMSIVYKGKHKLMDRIVAVKLLRPELVAIPQLVERFKRESKAISTLRHPNIVTVFDFGLIKDAHSTPFLIMDYLEGRTLDEVLKEEGKLNLTRAVELFSASCDALAHTHEMGIVHRDIKPSNLLLRKEPNGSETLTIFDFGIAKMLQGESSVHKLTASGEVFGSPLYMSPEQVSAKEIGAASDVYSLGCVIFEALAGKPPYRGDSANETMLMHKKNPVPDLPVNEFHGEAIPPTLASLVRDCLDKDPENRPSIERLGIYLETLLSDLNPEPEPEPEEQDEKRNYNPLDFLKSNFRVGTTLVVILLLAITGSIVFFTRASQKDILPVTGNSQQKAFVTSADRLGTLPDYKPFIDSHFKYSAANKTLQATEFVRDEDLLLLKNHKEDFNYLILHNSHIRGKTFWAIKDLPINFIDLADTNITDSSLKQLAMSKTISYIDLSSCTEITDKGIKHLVGLKSLRGLILESARVNDETMKILMQMPQLTELGVKAPCRISDLGMDRILTLKHLNNLNISGNYFSTSKLRRLKELQNLEILNVSNCKLNNNSLKELTSLKLRALSATGNSDITAAGINNLKGFGQIDLLYLSGNNIDDNNLKTILALRPATLDIAFTKVSPAGLKLIADCDFIEVLGLAGLNLTDRDLEPLAKMKLKSLSIESNRLTDACFETLAKMKNLKTLSLKKSLRHSIPGHSNDGVTGSGIERFRKLAPNCLINN
ncbi:MAG: protein kinase [Candidatus Obscuribacterales bacterium]|nr:protein kinase [Candidatus Obscuribacterales bacterium]